MRVVICGSNSLNTLLRTSVRRLGCLRQAFIKVTYSTTRLCTPRPRHRLILTQLPSATARQGDVTLSLIALQNREMHEVGNSTADIGLKMAHNGWAVYQRQVGRDIYAQRSCIIRIMAPMSGIIHVLGIEEGGQ